MIGSVSLKTPEFLFVCVGPTCGERGGVPIHAEWKQALLETKAWDRWRAVPVRCFGECATGPNAACPSRQIFLRGIAPNDARQLLGELMQTAHERASP